jgi:hypothetical protein
MFREKFLFTQSTKVQIQLSCSGTALLFRYNIPEQTAVLFRQFPVQTQPSFCSDGHLVQK